MQVLLLHTLICIQYRGATSSAHTVTDSGMLQLQTPKTLNPLYPVVRHNSMINVGGFVFQQPLQGELQRSQTRTKSSEASRTKRALSAEEQLRADINAAFIEIMVAAADPQVCVCVCVFGTRVCMCVCVCAPTGM
jgi:hypothetical protein